MEGDWVGVLSYASLSHIHQLSRLGLSTKNSPMLVAFSSSSVVVANSPDLCVG